MWTPGREDLAIELCGEIGDEDGNLIDRAETRAERFEDYSDKRAADAERARQAVAAIADNIPLGQPILIGHHSEKHARRDQAKIENGMRRAVKMWETSTYWTDRAAAAIRHAKYLERPDVRARRIKKIEAEQRKATKSNADGDKFNKAWAAVARLDNDPEKQRALALTVANFDHCSKCFTLAEFPRNPPASQYEGWTSLWSAITDDIITPAQAAEIAIRIHEIGKDHRARWLAHYANRLAYERAMLADQGGTVADKTGPEVGGAVRCWASPGYGRGWSYIRKVNKVTVTVSRSYDSGRTFPQTMPLDKLQAVMTRADVEAARGDGSLHDTEDKTGFYLFAPPETRDEAKDRTHREHVAAAEAKKLKDEDFDATRASLRGLCTRIASCTKSLEAAQKRGLNNVLVDCC